MGSALSMLVIAGTEKLFGKTMQSILTSMLPARVEVLASGVDLDPFQLG